MVSMVISKLESGSPKLTPNSRLILKLLAMVASHDLSVGARRAHSSSSRSPKAILYYQVLESAA